ncbi:DUF6497 family protein [Aliiroseovarius crassostreae]|uniref:DUF6497 family protein n=1 Tax=Aliiroseovarius crassostreae TaxID=154981 RepID=UPI00223C3814|nr:DUF6497 family protein [Aliiroseovarius crassostreae]
MKMTLAQIYKGLRGQVGVGAFAALLSLGLALSAPAPAGAGTKRGPWVEGDPVSVPSGQPVEFLDVIQGVESAEGVAVRYRFLAPTIAGDMAHVSFAQAEEDMAALCQDYVLPRLMAGAAALPDQIIIVLADREVEFGMADPDATQYFEAYRPEDGACFWEGF